MPGTYKDIQRQTGLSLATISKFYNGGTVLEANRQAIVAAAAAVDYRPNETARSLRTRRSRTLGVLLPELNNDFHLTIVTGIESSLRRDGISVLICSSRATDTVDRGAVDFLERRGVDALVAIPPAHEEAALQEAVSRGLRVVCVDRVVEGLASDTVTLDNRGASREVVDHLVARGHRRIAVITGPEDVWTMSERLAGASQAFADHDLPLDPAQVVSGPLTTSTGRLGLTRLVQMPEPPTAVYCTNYELTLGALMAVSELGLQVPQDISLVGFDSEPLAAVTRPRTTMYVQPVAEMADAAATLVRDHMGQDAHARPPRAVTLRGRLLPGGSVADLASAPPR
ncbi:LacI family DNA-binding transcriptional regulator [Pseudokineococcus marinus]|uniref:LacI family DNA-binding transcriptional regulator n=1 Tax=Pseudokineococcus marinus TaxID=351215 RepID=A0A849BIF6_9ACTN|nr:LacI family DNA-binding transcriptional regulator [Pseudokineococcus marinus]NNH22381.1 LacI family DNA-binding transcriptional regulator [Pseudokineococcus marinus]